VDEEVRRIVDGCYSEARRCLRENRDKLDAIVEKLLKHETLDEAAIYLAAGIERPSSNGAAEPATPAPREPLASPVSERPGNTGDARHP
jgi:cell division protease FtsH